MRSSTWCCLKTAVAVEQRWSQPSPAGSSCRNSTLRRRLEDQLVSHPSSSPLISDFARQTCPSSLSPMILMLSSIKALTPRQDCPNKVFLRSWPEVQKHWYPSHLFHIIHLSFFFSFLECSWTHLCHQSRLLIFFDAQKNKLLFRWKNSRTFFLISCFNPGGRKGGSFYRWVCNIVNCLLSFFIGLFKINLFT